MQYERPQRGEEDVRPRFALGQLLATPGALAALAEAQTHPLALVARHVTGDWGVMPEEDQEANEWAVGNDGRIMSAYVLPTGVKVWLITEWDRSATTLLLPADY